MSKVSMDGFHSAELNDIHDKTLRPKYELVIKLRFNSFDQAATRMFEIKNATTKGGE